MLLITWTVSPKNGDGALVKLPGKEPTHVMPINMDSVSKDGDGAL